MSNWDEIDITTPDPEETEPNENEETEVSETEETETGDTEETENPSSLGSGLLGGPLGGGLGPGLTLGLGASPAALTSTGNDLGEENESGRLTWDGTGKRFFENGVDHGILFVSNGDGTYRNGIVWNGLTTVTESPDGAEPNDLWADNMKYATLYSNETFGATIEAYTYPDEFSECDGSYEPMPGVYYGQQDRKPFAFCYRTHVGNDTGLNAYKLHIVYNCKASPSEKSYETINDSPDAITFSWEVSTIPVPHGNIKLISTITIDESKLDERGLEIYYELLDKLYGSDNNPSTLPSTDEIADMFGSYEGNPIVFKATKPTPLSKTVVNIEPVQDLHGYDHPWPAGGGKNKCYRKDSVLPKTSNDITFSADGIDGVKINGTATSTYGWNVFRVNAESGKTYVLSIDDSSKLFDGFYINFMTLLNDSIVSTIGGITRGNPTKKITCDGTFNIIEFRTTIETGVTVNNVVIRAQAEEGSTATAYEPYSNICPITGYDAVSVTRTGKNLLPPMVDGTYEGNGVKAVVVNGVATLSGTTNASGNALIIPLASAVTIPSVTYYHVMNSVVNDSVNPSIELSTNTSNPITKSFNAVNRIENISDYAGQQVDRVRFWLGNGVTISGTYSPMFMVSNTPTDYEPYAGATYTITFPENDPGTICGGTLDVNTGELEVTYGYIESYSGQTLSGKWISDRDVYSEDTSPTTGAEVAYELAEPQTYQLTSQQMSILSLTGTNVISTDSGNTLEITYREDVGAAASSGYTKQQLLNLSDPLYVKNLVRIGTAEQVFDIGDQFNVTWNDGENTYDCPFDVVHFGKVINKHGQEVNAMYLQSHWVLPGIQFDASEAIYYADEAMAAGTYYFTIGDNWSTGFVKNDVIAFTTTQQIPAGGQVVIGSSTSAYTWGGEASTYSSWKIYTYASKESPTPIESVAVSQGTPIGDATNLGTITVSQKYSDTGLNNLQRASRGYARWSQSGVRQWLNSDVAAGSWWTAQNNYDRPPEQLSTKRGFMAGLSANFLDMIDSFYSRTALNTVSDSDIGTSETTLDKFALASLEQEYAVPQLVGVEGESFQYWIDKLGTDSPQATGSDGTNTEHIRQLISDHSSAQNIRLRSTYLSYSYNTYYVSSGGLVSSYNATAALGLCPICVVY